MIVISTYIEIKSLNDKKKCEMIMNLLKKRFVVCTVFECDQFVTYVTYVPDYCYVVLIIIADVLLSYLL